MRIAITAVEEDPDPRSSFPIVLPFNHQAERRIYLHILGAEVPEILSSCDVVTESMLTHAKLETPSHPILKWFGTTEKVAA